jgi:L-ribulose-5-phosphate 3-epimerase
LEEKMKIGVIISLNDRVEEEFRQVKGLGLPTCQLNGWNQAFFTPEMAERVKEASRVNRVEITSFWCGWEGPAVWDNREGPLTLGIVPVAYRYDRLKMLIRGADFARLIGVSSLTTHVGFIPENCNDPEYPGVLSALRIIAQYCRGCGLDFLFETGQETPVTLLRTIEDLGLDNVGINLDPANLILYGKGNPVDALDVIGRFVRGVHAKDGLYPASGRVLGVEVPLGEGKVNVPVFVRRLKEIGYDGALTIEREISGEQQTRDILSAKALLESLI